MPGSADSITSHCFGQRMFGPYRGVMHSVTTPWADAVTTDGRDWLLYVRGECLYDDPDEADGQAISVSDVKYGRWSQKEGLQRAPIRLPTLDARVREEGSRLLAAVQTHAAELPFPLRDRFELWLLHKDSGLPLALIASACGADQCETPALLRWTPGQRCMAELPEAVSLLTVIAELAGHCARAQWFERHADGSGTACSAAAHGRATIDGRLPAAHFPPLFVDRAALDEQQAKYLTAVQQWQAPSLLQLPGLDTRQREEFERAACRHALRLAEQLPLIPCVLDRAAVTAALVEARLRRSHQQAGGGAVTAARPLSPDYLEMPEG